MWKRLGQIILASHHSGAYLTTRFNRTIILGVFLFASPVRTFTLTVWVLAIPLGAIGLGIMGYALYFIWS